MKGWSRISGILAVLTVGACAGVPVPTAQVAVAQSALEEAQSAGAAKHAPVELAAAREKLEGARRAVVEEDYDRARFLAEQAEMDGKLAAVRARSNQAEQAVAALQESIRTLREETNRVPARKP